MAMADSRVEQGVEHVDKAVDDHKSYGDEEYDALQDHEVARVDGSDQEPAKARQCEDRLNDDRSTDEAAYVDAGDRDKRQRGWPERVHKEDAPGPQALGFWRAQCSPPAG
jgi:hypothetical protein